MRSLRKAAFFTLAYVAGLAIALVYFPLRGVGLVRVEHAARLPRWRRRLLIVTNHPSLIEAFLLPMLFFREWVFSPGRWAPWSMPDRTNMKRFDWFFWVGDARNIPVPRHPEPGESRAAFETARRRSRRKLLAVLRWGGRVFMFPEGGRTASVPPDKRLRSPGGHELRPLRDGVGEIILQSGALVLPIWIEFPPGPVLIRFRIGEAMDFNHGSAASIVQELQRTLLDLADEAPPPRHGRV